MRAGSGFRSAYIILLLGFSIVVPCLSFAAPNPGHTVRNLTVKQLKNATYDLPGSEGRVTLKKGVSQAGSMDKSTYQLVQYDRAGFGDIDGDGVDEAAVVMWESGGGSGAFYFLCIVKNRNGKPVCIAATEDTFGDRIEVDSVKVLKGKVVMKALIQGFADGLCCPTQPARITCTLVRGKNRKLKLVVKEEKLKPLTPRERAEVEKRYHGP